MSDYLPFGGDTVTVLHRVVGESWTPCVVLGASWQQRAVRAIANRDAELSDETTCRIPAGNVVPDPGDVIVLGTCSESAADDIALTALLEKYRPQGAFRVQSVADNARPGMPLAHYAARGS